MAESDDALSMRASLDQAREGVKSIAEIIRAYHDALRKEGFSKDQALELTIEYQKSIIKPPGGT